jgi:hypothetical protein
VRASYFDTATGLVYRGNGGGGYVVMLKRLLGHFFDKDVKIADVKYRKKTEEVMANKP